MGYPCLRTKGPAFAIVTLALSQALRIIAYVLDGVTGGGNGLSLSPVASLTTIYYALAAAAAAMIAASIFIDRSTFGLHLKAIRDDEVAAEAIGIPTTRQKLRAFVLSAVAPGYCGGLYAVYLNYIHPEEVFSLRINVTMVVMVLLGGGGTVFGPVLGALLLFGVSEILWAKFPLLHQLVFGLLLMGLVVLLPNGILGGRRRAASASG